MLDLQDYAAAHRAELERLLATPAWQEVIEGGLLAEVRRSRLEPGSTRDFIGTVVEQLLASNEASVAAQVAAGGRDRDALVERLGRWPARLDGRDPLVSFLGLTLTHGCNFDPRCLYCTQEYREPVLGLEDWKRVVNRATRGNGGAGPYVYITGGEALTLEEELWGDDGLVSFATRCGAAVNVNTNASLMTPKTALMLIKAGLSKLHVSMDTADAALQDELWGEAGRRDRVLEGLNHMQLARDLVGVTYPEIHINCVLTSRNLAGFPQLFAFLLARKKRVARRQPLFHDLMPHVIPVGGDGNRALRPETDDFARFYGEVWCQVTDLWQRYQTEALGLSEEDCGSLIGYFRNPYERVAHDGGLESYLATSADGHYGALALSPHCYVAPTQASITPDGLQYRCGAHAVHRHLPTGSVVDADLFDNLRDGIAELDDLPRHETCDGCAMATLFINQAVHGRLVGRVDELLAAADSTVEASP